MPHEHKDHHHKVTHHTPHGSEHKKVHFERLPGVEHDHPVEGGHFVVHHDHLHHYAPGKHVKIAVDHS